MSVGRPVLAGGLLLLAGCWPWDGDGGSNSETMPIVIPPPSQAPFWPQWGANPRHTGAVAVVGQGLARQLADIVYDPFVSAQMAESNGNLLTHYQAPIVNGNDVYVMRKSGTYTSCSVPRGWASGERCGPNTWERTVWNAARYSWVDGTLHLAWTFASNWKPPPNGAALSGWEPVFHPVDANGFLYVPGAGGTVWKVEKAGGTAVASLDPFPFAAPSAPNRFVAGPLSADADGNIYYNVIELVSPQDGAVDPWREHVVGAWLVKLTPDDQASFASFAQLVPGAPAFDAVACPGQFSTATTALPWPPDTSTLPPDLLCGAQRPGINVAPAIAPDGTIYTVSRAHFVSMAAYLVAVNSDLTPKWATSLQHLLSDGCGLLVPIAPPENPNQPNSCRNGANLGVDPRTNQMGSGVVPDLGTSSPAVLPDGSVLYGAQTNYNGRRGHLMRFGADGAFLDSYDFGWDITPAIWEHDGTWSVVIKDNHYPVGMYCSGGNPICAPLPESYYITQLDANLEVEWRFRSTNALSCSANPGGPPSCVSDHPNGFEWCINMPAIDANGTVYANSEDGRLYSLAQGNAGEFTNPTGSIFLNLALGAAYTPLTLGADGRIYTQNDGHLFVVGD